MLYPTETPPVFTPLRLLTNLFPMGLLPIESLRQKTELTLDSILFLSPPIPSTGSIRVASEIEGLAQITALFITKSFITKLSAYHSVTAIQAHHMTR